MKAFCTLRNEFPRQRVNFPVTLSQTCMVLGFDSEISGIIVSFLYPRESFRLIKLCGHSAVADCVVGTVWAQVFCNSLRRQSFQADVSDMRIRDSAIAHCFLRAIAHSLSIQSPMVSTCNCCGESTFWSFLIGYVFHIDILRTGVVCRDLRSSLMQYLANDRCAKVVLRAHGSFSCGGSYALPDYVNIVHIVFGTFGLNDRASLQTLRKIRTWRRRLCLVLVFDGISTAVLPQLGRSLFLLCGKLGNTRSSLDIVLGCGGFFLTHRRARRRKRVSLDHSGMVEILHEILVNFSVNLSLICEEGVIDGAGLIRILDPSADLRIWC